jgi:transcription initiation factor TFIID subunit TAF12
MKNLLILFIALVAFSCTDKSAEEAAKLKDETFKIHDDVMPISMNLEDLKEKVMKKVEMDSTNKKTALDISLALDKAYNEMEVWMPKLGDAADMKDGEEKVKTLIELKAEGEKIKQNTLDAKKLAEEFLK